MAASHGGLVAHHFDNLRQQQATVRFGMWLFLATEVLFFGGVLCAYTAYRIWFPREFEVGSAALNVGIASVNTFLLLASSLTITLGIRAAYAGNPKGLQMWLGLTIILGSAFLGLKMREYYLDYKEGLVPGGQVSSRGDDALGYGVHQGTQRSSMEPTEEKKVDFVGAVKRVLREEKGHSGFDPDATENQTVNYARVQLFFMFYYSMTGLHVLHMVIGIGVLGWQFVIAKRGFFDHPERYVYIEVMSLYWHFVDMVWIFLLPLLYLAGPHSLGQAVAQFSHALGMGH